MLGMLKRHEIEILLKAGHGKAEVARLSGASLRSVKRIAQESPVLDVDDAAERAQRSIGRPSMVSRKIRFQMIANMHSVIANNPAKKMRQEALGSAAAGWGRLRYHP